MVVAAYLVGGFLIASVYATGMLRGRRDRCHYLGFIIPFTVGAIAAPVQIGIGDGLARWVYDTPAGQVCRHRAGADGSRSSPS
jgi:cytochrome d ubiquinol oxidase subunit I